MSKSTDQQEQATNASVGYGPNNPEPLSFKEAEIPKDKDALHSAGEYINSTPSVNPTTELANRTEP